MSQDKDALLFVAKPNQDSVLLNSQDFCKRFTILHHDLTTVEDFLSYLKTHESKRIVAIYGGYPAFHKIGGLTAEIINHADFPSESLKCIALCSRGYNGIDLDALKKHNIRLYNYQDDKFDHSLNLDSFSTSLVGNEVADCVLWHVLEGFRKFSYQQLLLRQYKNTLQARAKAANKSGFAFGHELTIDSNASYVSSPHDKSCLIMGMGSIGKQIANKLYHGLGMKIHYIKRQQDLELEMDYPDWVFHKLDDSLLPKLSQFHAIIIALPGLPQTKHLINKKFLDSCRDKGLVLVNIGRGFILDLTAIKEAIASSKITHLGIDVFYDEPEIDAELLKNESVTSMTPHIGSSTREVFEQSCDYALSNIFHTLNNDQYESAARIV